MFRKWKLRLLLLWVEYWAKRNKVWTIDFVILYHLSKLLDKKMLEDKDKKVLIQTRVSACYRNAGETVAFLKILANTVAIPGETTGNLPDSPFKKEPVFEKYSLERFIINVEGNPVPLDYIVDEIKNSMAIINQHLSGTDMNDIRKKYYKRMAAPLYATVFSLMEALFEIALS